MIRFMGHLPLAFLLFLGSEGCATQLNLDSSPPAAASNYPTAEFRAQGKVFHGLGEVALKKGEPLSSIDLSVQGYFEGTIRVDSSFCHVRKSVNYIGTESVSFLLTGNAEDSCVIDIVTSVIWPESYDKGTLVYEMKGQLLVKVIPDERPYFLASTKVPQKFDTSIFVPVEPITGSLQVVFKGCGYEYIDTVPVYESVAMLSVRKMAGLYRQDRCIHEGFIDMLTGIKRVSWNIWSYAREFVPLSLPRLEWKGGKLRVDGDPSTAVIILDRNYLLSSKAVFDFDQEKNHMLRLLTIKGRSAICQWTYEYKEWSCHQ